MKKQTNFSVGIVLTCAVLFSTSVNAQFLAGTGSYSGAPGFDRGYQATWYCGNNPESWIRGSAFLNKQTGVLTMHIQLETDATHAGPKGQILVYITDAHGNLLARVASAEVGRGGKGPGTAEWSNFQASMYVGADVANRAAHITVVPHPTGVVDRLWNVSYQTLTDATGYIQQFALFFF